MNRVFELGFNKTSHELSIDQLPVRGRLPDWLSGTLVRNGPGTLKVGEQRYRHWFDGLAMLHKFSFANGRVSYANKFLDTRAYRENMAEGRIAYSEFATDPCRDLFARVMAVFSPRVTDNAKVSLAKIAHHYMALAETPIQVEFDPQTLASVGVFQFEQNVQGQMTTVHPHFDYARDEVYNVVTRYHRISHYRVYKFKGQRPPVLGGEVAARQPAYMHSFGMSQNYVLLTEFPLVVNPLNLLLWLRPYIENFRWKPGRGTPIWVVNRHTGETVGRFDADPFFAFHHVNAWEQGDEIIFDIDAYPDAEVINSFYLHRLEDPTSELPFGTMRRYRIPLKGNMATWETLSDACIELPRFDYERYNMDGSYRYVYGSSIRPEQRRGFYNQIAKIDLRRGEAATWWADDCYPGEPVFVGRPGRSAEDDGVVLSVVLDAARGISYLLVLDAASFGEIARAELPQPVLFGYHGAHFEDVQ